MNSERSWLCTAVALGVIAGFARLPESGLQFLDSWCYARVSVEMASSGDWVVPTWRGEPFLEKPPLLYWITAVLFQLFGVSDLGARALAGASVTGCVLLVYALGTRAAGRSTGLSGAILLCLLPMFLKWGRTYTTDPPFAFLCLGSLACAWGGSRQPWLWPAAGAVAGLAVLTRGAAALPLLVTLAAMVYLQRGASPGPRGLSIAAAVVVFVAVAVPWHWMVLERAGDRFIDSYIGTHTIQRLHSNLIDSPRAADRLYYLKHLGRTGWPALPLIVWGLVRLRRAWRPRCDPAGLLDRSLLVYVGAQVVMLAVVASRSPRYLLPLYPALALLAARGLAHGLGVCATHRLRRWSAAGLATIAVAISVWPAPIGTPRGRPFQALQAALEREPEGAVVGVDPVLRDAWFDRAFWFYLGRSPGQGSDERGLRVVPLSQAASCEPPGCEVLERAGPLALTARRRAAPSPPERLP